MLFGLGTAALSVCFALLNSQQNLLAQNLNWPASVVGITILVVAWFLYRCPYCGKFPEKDDIPTFNPTNCGKCGAKLK